MAGSDLDNRTLTTAGRRPDVPLAGVLSAAAPTLLPFTR